MCWLSKYPPIRRSAPISLIYLKFLSLKIWKQKKLK